MQKNNTPLKPNRPWLVYEPTYRSQQMRILARWILTGTSGSVVGLSGSGKSNLIGFLCYRPEALQHYLPDSVANAVALVPVDLNTLPENTLSALYRVILRSFYEIRYRFEEEMQEMITQLYLENRAARDPFLPQSALRELLLHFQAREERIVFALDQFDAVCRMLTPEMGDTLRGLRDGFKDTVSYIVGMRQGLIYLPDPEILGSLYQILDTQICYVGPLDEDDARVEILKKTRGGYTTPTEEAILRIFALTGGYPSLITAVSQWWLSTPTRPKLTEWREILLAEPSIQHRLGDIWTGLPQEEQSVLSNLQTSPMVKKSAMSDLAREKRRILEKLVIQGLCTQNRNRYAIFSELFSDYVQQVGGRSRGNIWTDQQTGILYQGQKTLNHLTPKEHTALLFFTQQPRIRHTYSDIIVATWPEEENYEGVSNDSLYQIISGLRRKIEPDPTSPVYVVNWRGKPEGGYQFFPEGRPG